MISAYLWVTEKEDLQKCFNIREKVFINEQGFLEEFDDIDNIAHHLLFLDDEKEIATARLFIDENKNWHIGRVCVLKEYRGNGIGAFLIKECILKAKELNQSSTVVLGAQLKAKKFYEKLGFIQYGEIFYEEDCPHIMMKISLKNNFD